MPWLFLFGFYVICTKMTVQRTRLCGKMRTETDTCVIAILDERASHGRRYYAAMRGALPDMRTTSSLRAVTKFLRELKPESYFEVDA